MAAFRYLLASAVVVFSLPLFAFPNKPVLHAVDDSPFLEVDWAQIKAGLPEHPCCRPRLVVDGERWIDPPKGITSWRFSAVLREQHDVVVEMVEPSGKVFHRSDPALYEVYPTQVIRPESFASIPALEIDLPRSQATKFGVDTHLARLAVDISRRKVSWILRPGAAAGLKRIPPRSASVRVHFDPRGRAKTVVVVDEATHRVVHPKASNFFFKVDAAFSGNSFFWDDMFVSLETAWHLPALAESTLDFWYSIQRDYGTGVIPREVRKSNRLSFNSAVVIDEGHEFPNGGYTNPNLSGWVEWELYALKAPAAGALRLPAAIRSLQAYSCWQTANRSVEGSVSGEWQNNLGSGMDNSPRGGGTDTDKNQHTVWVDLLAQRIGMERYEARMYAVLGKWADADSRERNAEAMEADLNAHHWSEKESFFFDRVPAEKGLRLDEATATIAGFWPLWSTSVSEERVEALVQHQLTPDRFGGRFPLPALSRAHPRYSDEGHYWLGGRWPSTAAMAISGLEHSGRPDTALELTRAFLRGMSEASAAYAREFGRGTVFEFYGVRGDGHAMAGVEPGHATRSDFAGWGAVPPVYSQLRSWVGLRPVPGFAGPSSQAGRWLGLLDDSQLFRNTNYRRYNPFAGDPTQRQRAASGYLEWNLPFDPGQEKIEVRNLVYRGSRIQKLEVQVLSPDKWRLSVRSDRPFSLQLNRLFDGPKTLTLPNRASRIERIGGSPRKDQTIDVILSSIASAG